MLHEKTMTALYKTKEGAGNMELREAPVPSPKPNEVLLEIKACGICGTDINIKNSKFQCLTLPVIIGHEFAGQIVELGAEVTGYKVGDRVVGEPHLKACGKCEFCCTGNIQLCAQKRAPGWGMDGAFAKYLVVPEHLLHRLPDSVSYEEGALVEPAAATVTAVLDRCGVEVNDTVAVFGSGPYGLLSAMAARAGGAGRVIIIANTEDEKLRLPVARQLGFEEIVLADKQDVEVEMMKLTNNRGADLVIEASGSTRAIAQTFLVVRKLGRITQVCLPTKDEISIPWNKAAWKVCTVTFNFSSIYRNWVRAISLIASKKIDVSKIITMVRPLKDWEEAFAKVEAMETLQAILIP